ncbi:MAG: hypothetical protein OXC95_02540 [Dehalococcoidia bacterium]|nr:hypothetical protein [Dehalococcoidia bacterium]
MSAELMAIIVMGFFLGSFILVTFHGIEHRIDERIIDGLQQRVCRAERRVDSLEARLRTVEQYRVIPKSWAV